MVRTARLAYDYQRLRNFDHWPRSAIEQRRDAATRSLIDFAYGHVPFYQEAMRQRGLKPSDFHTADDLRQLPIIDKDDIVGNEEQFAPTGLDTRQCLEQSTSGTTFQPISIYYDPQGIYFHLLYSRRGKRGTYRALLGKENPRTLFVVQPKNTSYKTQEYVRNLFFVPSSMAGRHNYQSILAPYEEIFERINKERPDVLSTYGSFVDMLVTFIKLDRHNGYIPPVIKYSSDSASSSSKRFLEQEFGTKVLASYTSCEAMTSAYQCQLCDKYHVADDAVHIDLANIENEFVEPDSGMGALIVTNLYNRGTVLINYKIGDHGTLGIGCECGANCTVLRSLDGREADLVLRQNGELVSPLSFTPITTRFPVIAGFQIIQETLSDFTVKLILGSDSQEEVENQIRSYFSEEVNIPEAQLKFKYVAEIPREANGKLRYVLSRVEK